MGGGINSNANANVINRKGTIVAKAREGGLDSTILTYVTNNIEVNNPTPATGGGPGDTAEDIRLNAIANFSAQKRTVTKDDYIFRALSMPPQFGSVAKAYLTQDTQISLDTNKRISNPNALNLYVLGYDINKHLNELSLASKTNLATYIEQFRMLTDAINIKNASVINFKVEFNITVKSGFSNDGVLLGCINSLKSYFNIDNWQINQPIIKGDITGLLYNVDGVLNVNNVSIENKFGENLGYSKFKYNFEAATRNNTIYPSLDPSIFELKYPNTDIIGRITN